MSGIERFSVTVSQIEVPQLAVFTARGVMLDSNRNLIVQGEKDSRAFSPHLWESFEVRRLASTLGDDTQPVARWDKKRTRII